MATETEPTITDAVLSWPCCVHCLPQRHDQPHPDRCIEPVRYPQSPDMGTELHPCQGGRYG